MLLLLIAAISDLLLTRGAPMSQLKDFGWWPNVWIDETGNSSTPTEISNDAVLKNVRRTFGSLTLVADRNGVIYTATLGSHLSEDFLILLRHILLQHLGEPISGVEQFDVTLSDKGIDWGRA